MMNFKTKIFGSNKIRYCFYENHPWWVFDDICSALELYNKDILLKKVDLDDRKFVEQNLIVLNAAGVIAIVLGNNRSKAFKNIFISEIMPEVWQEKTVSKKVEYPSLLLIAEIKKLYGSDGAAKYFSHLAGVEIELPVKEKIEKSDQSITFFVENYCINDIHAVCKSSKLYSVYVDFLKKENKIPASQTMFSLELSKKGYEKHRRGDGYYFRGISPKGEINV
jgi:hypothetical protein